MDENTQAKFDAKLKELLAVAKKKKNVLEYQEISDYFKDMVLEEEQFERILETLEQNNVDVLRIIDDDDDIPDDDLLLVDDEEPGALLISRQILLVCFHPFWSILHTILFLSLMKRNMRFVKFFQCFFAFNYPAKRRYVHP